MSIPKLFASSGAKGRESVREEGKTFVGKRTRDRENRRCENDLRRERSCPGAASEGMRRDRERPGESVLVLNDLRSSIDFRRLHGEKENSEKDQQK